MTAVEPDNFFSQKRTASEIKDKIWPRYFQFWLSRQVPNPESPASAPLIIIDGNSGEGNPAAENPTALVLLLKKVFESPNSLVKPVLLNPTTGSAEKLAANLAQLPFYPALPEAPEILTETTFQAQPELLGTGNQPTLCWADPGRVGLTRHLLEVARQQVATDILMVTTFKKLQQTLLAPEPGDWEKDFWGSQLPAVYALVQQQPNAKKQENQFMHLLAQALIASSFYLFKFRVVPPGKNGAPQYLLLITKLLPNYLGLKEMMHPYSDYQEDGVPLFQVANQPPVPLLPGFYRYLSNYTLENLVTELANNRSRFHYQTLEQIYQEHSVGTNYIKSNYRQALEKLREAGILYPVDARNKKAKAITDTSVIFYNLHRSKI